MPVIQKHKVSGKNVKLRNKIQLFGHFTVSKFYGKFIQNV